MIGFGQKTRNVHIIVMSYLAVTQPPSLRSATSRKMLWLREEEPAMEAGRVAHRPACPQLRARVHDKRQPITVFGLSFKRNSRCEDVCSSQHWRYF